MRTKSDAVTHRNSRETRPAAVIRIEKPLGPDGSAPKAMRFRTSCAVYSGDGQTHGSLCARVSELDSITEGVTSSVKKFMRTSKKFARANWFPKKIFTLSSRPFSYATKQHEAPNTWCVAPCSTHQVFISSVGEDRDRIAMLAFEPVLFILNRSAG
jgi:hypothetical protein